MLWYQISEDCDALELTASDLKVKEAYRGQKSKLCQIAGSENLNL